MAQSQSAVRSGSQGPCPCSHKGSGRIRMFASLYHHRQGGNERRTTPCAEASCYVLFDSRGSLETLVTRRLPVDGCTCLASEAPKALSFHADLRATLARIQGARVWAVLLPAEQAAQPPCSRGEVVEHQAPQAVSQPTASRSSEHTLIRTVSTSLLMSGALGATQALGFRRRSSASWPQGCHSSSTGRAAHRAVAHAHTCRSPATSQKLRSRSCCENHSCKVGISTHCSGPPGAGRQSMHELTPGC